jgi:adenosine deaminase
MRGHVETLVRAFDYFKQNCTASYFVDARLILSVNRTKHVPSPVETAHAIVDLAIEYRDRGVCGVGFGGNPFDHPFAMFRGAFDRAREHGLGVTVHCGETDNEEDTSAIFDFRPDRVGHCCCLSEANDKRLQSLDIPIEVCMTSNLVTKNVDHIAEHPIQRWLRRDQRLCICTDDKGVFNNSLAKEYDLVRTFYTPLPTPPAAATANTTTLLSSPSSATTTTTTTNLPEWLFQLSRGAADFCFCAPDTKRLIEQQFDIYKNAWTIGEQRSKL